MTIKMIARVVLAVIFYLIVAADTSVSAAASEYRLEVSSVMELTIQGEAIATQAQCVSYLTRHNPLPELTVTPKELVKLYYEEGQREGLRPDVAFAQALHETGFFRYGGDVVPFQNNYCGLGTTGGGVKGAWFTSARIGVRAQIQHLLAYTTTRAPRSKIVDPRYELVKYSDRFGKAKLWTDLNGKWAVPGTQYGQRILRLFTDILSEKRVEKPRYRYADEVDVWHDADKKREVHSYGDDKNK